MFVSSESEKTKLIQEKKEKERMQKETMKYYEILEKKTDEILYLLVFLNDECNSDQSQKLADALLSGQISNIIKQHVDNEIKFTQNEAKFTQKS